MSLEQLRQMSKARLAQTAGFYVAVVWVVGLFLIVFNFVLAAIFLVWFDPTLVDIHVIHDFALSSFVWVLGLSMVVQLYRPATRSTAVSAEWLTINNDYVTPPHAIPTVGLNGPNPS